MSSVTIITLAYENLDELHRTLKSVCAQDFTNVGEVQYIVADDGSRDYCEGYIFSLFSELMCDIAKFNKLEVYSNDKNVGTVKSFNKAIKKSTGDIVITLSCGDEFFSADTVCQIVKCFSLSGAPIITGFRQIVNGNKAVKVEPPQKVIDLFKPGRELSLLKHLILYGNFISGASTYYSRSYLESVGGFDERFRLLEDYPFYLRALNDGVRIDFFEKIFMKHSLGGGSDRNKPRNKLLENDFQLVHDWICSNVELGWLNKRFHFYNSSLSKSDKLRFKNILKYPDCLFRNILRL